MGSGSFLTTQIAALPSWRVLLVRLLARAGWGKFHFPESDMSLLMKGNTPFVRITDKDTPMPTAFSQTDWRHHLMRRSDKAELLQKLLFISSSLYLLGAEALPAAFL